MKPVPFRPQCLVVALFSMLALVLPALAGEEPPKSWIDPDTGHRVIRLTNEPGSDSFYFNENSYTPDGKKMAYTTPEGISVLDLATMEAKPLVKAPAKPIIVSHRSANLFYTQPSTDPLVSSVWQVNIETGEKQKLVELPRRAKVATINADETLAAGTLIEGDANAGGAYDGTKPGGKISATNMGEPEDKSGRMAKRLAAKLPSTLFTIDLESGKVRNLIEHSTDWLNHLQFSPADPTLLMYCHEGSWQLVDRIWTIRTDGTRNQLVHKRMMEMEIAGHEWWGADGKTIFYQIHFPRGGRVSFIASYNVETAGRTWLQYNADQSSIHDNSSPDAKLYCGDGDNNSPWIFLFRPTLVPSRGTVGENLIKGGYLESEKLVNMSKHNYRLEPNPTFSPDLKFIIFRSNMLGTDYVFAVEIAKTEKR